MVDDLHPRCIYLFTSGKSLRKPICEVYLDLLGYDFAVACAIEIVRADREEFLDWDMLFLIRELIIKPPQREVAIGNQIPIGLVDNPFIFLIRGASVCFHRRSHSRVMFDPLDIPYGIPRANRDLLVITACGEQSRDNVITIPKGLKRWQLRALEIPHVFDGEFSCNADASLGRGSSSEH
jgi:hypothetical protein